MNYDDETLMAFADGELEEPRRAEIAAAVQRDPALARRVEQHRALRAQVSGAFSRVMDQAVPERLRGAARGATPPVAGGGRVLQFPALTARAASTPWRAREWGAMAASVMLGAFISWKVFSPGPPLVTARDGALLASGALSTALDSQLASTQQGSEPVLIGLTFRGTDGHFCRSFALRAAGTAGLACRVDGQWRIPVTAAAPGGEGMRQATSMPPEVLTAIGARLSGEALDAAAEQRALRAGWDAPATR